MNKVNRLKKVTVLLLVFILIAITLIPLNSNVVQAAAGDVAINATNFPDTIFREYVKTNYDKNSDGILSVSERNAVTTINIWNRGMSDLKGVEYFTSLKNLDCQSNKLTRLDLSKNTALVSLTCSGNMLTRLDLSKNTTLESLNCGDNNLTRLDVSKSIKLYTLYCFRNKLTRLDLSKNTELWLISCEYNNLTSLDLTKNTRLLKKCTWVSNQASNGTYTKSNGKYIVDLTQFAGLNPAKVTVTDGGVKSGNIVTYATPPSTMSYTYATGFSEKPMTVTVSLKFTILENLILTGKGKSKSTALKWNKVNGATGYVLYYAKCGKKYKKYKTFSATKRIYTKKHLKKGKCHKYYIRAFKIVNGKRMYIKKSLKTHVTTTGGKYTNAKKITVKPSKLTLKKKATKKLKAKVFKVNKKKALIRHVYKIRYQSSDTKVASVGRSGKIKAKNAGICYVYAVGANGVYKRIKVTVK